MKLTGQQIEAFVNLLCDAFSRDELAILTRTALDIDLNRVVSGGRLESVAFELVQWVGRQGRTAELLRAVQAARPKHPGVAGFAGPLLAAAGPPPPAAAGSGAAFPVAELQAASVAARTLADEFAHGNRPTAAEVAAIRTRAVEAVASAAVPVPTLTDHVLNETRESITEAVEEWKTGMASGNPLDWVKATDQLRAKVCQLLGIARRLCGGRLPDDLLKLWADNRCGG